MPIPIPPSEKHLSRLYYELGKIGARSAGHREKWPCAPAGPEDLVVIAAEWSRWDPRLLEILVNYSMRHWKGLIPQKIRSGQKEMETPQTLGVLSSFLVSADPDDKERALFWEYVVAGLKKVEPQFYFRDLYLPGSLSAEKEARESLEAFSRWGFLGRERIRIEASGRRIGSWGQPARIHILKRLFKKKEKLKLSDYLSEIENTVSRQQALLDLKKVGARSEGSGRGAVWKLP